MGNYGERTERKLTAWDNIINLEKEAKVTCLIAQTISSSDPYRESQTNLKCIRVIVECRLKARWEHPGKSRQSQV
jgi:hypothetical protein